MDHKPEPTWQVMINVALIVVLWVIDSPFHLCRRALERLRVWR